MLRVSIHKTFAAFEERVKKIVVQFLLFVALRLDANSKPLTEMKKIWPRKIHP